MYSAGHQIYPTSPNFIIFRFYWFYRLRFLFFVFLKTSKSRFLLCNLKTCFLLPSCVTLSEGNWLEEDVQQHWTNQSSPEPPGIRSVANSGHKFRNVCNRAVVEQWKSKAPKHEALQGWTLSPPHQCRDKNPGPGNIFGLWMFRLYYIYLVKVC